jgi:two-component system cell cycle response regulator DivK
VICLVEDHQDTRQMYEEFLSVSFQVMAAADGARALELMRSSPPDLLITDLSLPGIDGFDLIALVRKDPVLGRTPIICLSGYGGHGHEQRALAAGCDKILQKPYMPDALAATALEVIRSVRNRGIEFS